MTLRPVLVGLGLMIFCAQGFAEVASPMPFRPVVVTDYCPGEAIQPGPGQPVCSALSAVRRQELNLPEPSWWPDINDLTLPLALALIFLCGMVYSQFLRETAHLD